MSLGEINNTINYAKECLELPSITDETKYICLMYLVEAYCFLGNQKDVFYILFLHPLISPGIESNELSQCDTDNSYCCQKCFGNKLCFLHQRPQQQGCYLHQFGHCSYPQWKPYWRSECHQYCSQ